MKKAVLLVSFNRIDNLTKVFEAIRKAQPPRLYLASDGPREKVVGEKEKIAHIREWLLSNIDWKCEVKTRFLEKNSGGCAYGVSGAVTWFFENEKDGIVLEDDCVPSQSFFKYCEELLNKYKDNKKIWHITGYGYYHDKHAKETYYFSKIEHCWGWASWADRWAHFKLDLSDYDVNNIKKFSNRKIVQQWALRLLNNIRNSEHKDTWAWPWSFCIVGHGGYCINPYKNLVSNIGISEGEHYKGQKDNTNSLGTDSYELDKIIHPKKIAYNMKAVNYIYDYHYGVIKNRTNILQTIFSIKNVRNGEIKRKVITILGIKFKIRCKTKKTSAKVEEQKVSFYAMQTSGKLEGSNFPISLSDNERSFLLNQIKGAKNYMEFGSGGSTFLALTQSNVAHITSVESDAGWLKYLRKWQEITNAENKRLNFICVNIGKTGAWGVPIEEDKKLLWSDYSMAPFSSKSSYDVIFIDGRFRVACALQAILNSNQNTKILMHDFNNRAHYHCILEFLDIVDTADMLALFKIKKDCNKQRLLEMYEQYKYIYD